MRGNETPGRIVTNCCIGVGVHDVITCADLYYDRLRGLGVARGQILGFSIDLLRRPYNTLALPCECVMAEYCHNSCLKCQHFSATHARRRSRHSSIALSMMAMPNMQQTLLQFINVVHRQAAMDRLAAGQCHISSSRHG